jgi:hypothetical protein
MSKKEISTLKNDLAKKFVIDSLMQKGNITQEELQPFDKNFDFVQLIQKLQEILGKNVTKKKSLHNNKSTPQELEPKKPVDWTIQLAVINYLRRLFKFERNIFNQLFYGLKFYENILEFFNSIRSVLAQNALVLINEIFSEFVPELDEKNQKSPIINLIKLSIPALILKANTSQSFVKNEAKTCLETLVVNMKYKDTLLTLLQLMNTKKVADFELIYILSQKLIKNMGKEYLVNMSNFSSMMSALGDVYENNKSDLYKRRCKSIINTFNEVMTKKEFESKLGKCGKKEKEKINEILEERIPANTKKEIAHHNVLKSKDKEKSKDNKDNKSCDKLKNNCKTKPILKSNNNIKLVSSKLNQIKQKENSENINNINENVNQKNKQII